MKKCTKCGEEKELSEFHKKRGTKDGYRLRCKLCTLIQCKEYENNHREEINKQCKKYYQKNKKKIAERHKRWNKNNPEKHNKIKKRKEAKHRCNLGFNPLNTKFPGSVGHHINRNDVVYIPEELHRSISHRQGDAKSMNKINQLAQEYIQ